MPLLTGLLLSGLLAAAPVSSLAVEATAVEANTVYAECGLQGVMSAEAFRKAYLSMGPARTGAKVLAVADMTRPSTEKRLFIIDLQNKRLLLNTWVAHGRNSGDLNCEKVSNRVGSLQTSKGLYRVGEKIISPKHGDALLLHGLNRGVNDKALEREIIIHGADYVSQSFIAEHGRCGRSFGCPAVPRDQMGRVIDLLANGGLLYVYAR
ncbi:MAG TPA: murein L,D-transpeptidase catalytic domain family protein [Flavobacteriales bacterium]